MNNVKHFKISPKTKKTLQQNIRRMTVIPCLRVLNSIVKTNQYIGTQGEWCRLMRECKIQNSYIVKRKSQTGLILDIKDCTLQHPYDTKIKLSLQKEEDLSAMVSKGLIPREYIQFHLFK